MIELKDVIHYYIGSYLINASGNVCKFWGFAGDRCEIVYEPLTLWDTEYYKEVKIILKRLEDMTDDDIKGFIGWDKLNELYVDISFERCVNGIVVYYGIDTGPDNGGVFAQTHKITFHVFSPKEWKYLISKGFDLFGLIDTDQAIDAKTINAPMELNPYDDEPGV